MYGDYVLQMLLASFKLNLKTLDFWKIFKFSNAICHSLATPDVYDYWCLPLRSKNEQKKLQTRFKLNLKTLDFWKILKNFHAICLSLVTPNVYNYWCLLLRSKNEQKIKISKAK